MRTSSCERPMMRFGATALAIIVAALLAASMLSTPNASAAPIAPMEVKGYIYDESYDVVVGADVTVTTKDGETVKTSYEAVSDIGGYYKVTFGMAEYDFGCTIEVTATDGVLANTNTTVAVVDALWNWVNVTLIDEIPEFGGVSMVLIVSGIMVIFVVVGRRRR
jgi:hypothetical protein